MFQGKERRIHDVIFDLNRAYCLIVSHQLGEEMRIYISKIEKHWNKNWVESLLIVLMGFRTTYKEGLRASSAELVYSVLLKLCSFFIHKPISPEIYLIFSYFLT